MPIQLTEESGGKLLAVHVTGKLTAADYEHFVPEFERLVGLHGNLVEVTACMLVAGLGSGALVAALPAAAAAAAPVGETAMATGLTNTTKTIGGSFASSAFALALVQGVTTGTAAPMSQKRLRPLNIARMIAPVQRRPISSTARWNLGQNALSRSLLTIMAPF